MEFVDQSEAVRQMGRDDFARGVRFSSYIAFFGATSSASSNWRLGWLEAEQIAGLRAAETVSVPPESPVVVSGQIGESNE